jgi:hypothetical protein
MANIKSVPTQSAGVSASSTTTAWSFGSWVQITSGLSVVLKVIGIQFQESQNNPAVDTTIERLFEIGIGASGSEVTKLQIPSSVRPDTTTYGHYLPPVNRVWLPEPYFIPANTRIAVRVTDSTTTAVTYNGIKLIYEEDLPPSVILNSPNDNAITGTTPTFDFTGTDPNGDDVEYEIQISNDSNFTTSITNTISAGGNDFRWYYNALYFTNSQPDIGWGYGDSTYQANHSGLRFTNVTIPQGRAIVSARIDVVASQSKSTNAIARIYGVNADNAAAPTTYSEAENAPLTSAYVDWSNLPSWINDSTQSTPEIKAVVQEIVNRSGWSSGNAMTIYIKDNGTEQVPGTERKFWAYDGNASKVASLVVEYATGNQFYSKNSGIDGGFVNPNNQQDTNPFTSGNNIQYTIQSPLSDSTTYYWRVRAKDPSGSNTWGTWSATRSFTVQAGTTTSDNRSARTKGYATTADNRSARTKGVATTSDTRSARTKGVAISSDTRSAHTKGVATTFDNRNARTKGMVTTSDTRGARTKGIATTSDTRFARIKGVATISDNRSAKTKGGIIVTDNRLARIKGVSTAVDNRSARIKGVDTISNTRNARTKGIASTSDTRSARIKGVATTSDIRNARIKGYLVTSDTRNARTKGVATISDTRNVRIRGVATTQDIRGARIKGIATTSDTRGARTVGSSAVVSDSRSARIKGIAVALDNRSARTKGYATNSDNRLARTRGVSTISDTRNVRIKGIATTIDTRSARTKGLDIAGDTRNARTKGYFTTLDTRDARIKGKLTISDTKDAHIKGEETISDTRGARIKGAIASYRNAKVKGPVVTYPKFIFVDGDLAIHLFGKFYMKI